MANNQGLFSLLTAGGRVQFPLFNFFNLCFHSVCLCSAMVYNIDIRYVSRVVLAWKIRDAIVWNCERPFCEALKQKPALPWRSQKVREARTMGQLLRKAANREWNQPRKTALTSAMEMQSLEFAQLVSCLSLRITVKWLDESQKRPWTLDF